MNFQTSHKTEATISDEGFFRRLNDFHFLLWLFIHGASSTEENETGLNLLEIILRGIQGDGTMIKPTKEELHKLLRRVRDRSEARFTVFRFQLWMWKL